MKRSSAKPSAAFGLLLAALAVAPSSCGSDDGGESGLPPATTTGTRTMFPPVEKEIGPEGGRLELPDGTVLEVPEGALAERTTIKATVVRSEDGPKQLRYYHLEPNGLVFAKPATLRAKVPEAAWDAGNVTARMWSELHPVETDGSERSHFKPAEAAPGAPVRGEVALWVPHFTFFLLLVEVDDPIYLVTDIPAKYLLPGDLLFTLTDMGGPNWAPGHVGVFTGGRKRCAPQFTDEVIEAQDPTVRVSSLEAEIVSAVDDDGQPVQDVKPHFETEYGHFYLGARRPVGGLTPQERASMLDVLRGTVGASYSLVGGPITGYQSFSCVGLSEFALEAIGRSTIPANQEVLASVPLEQFMLTLPVREVTMHVGDTLEMPVYGTVVHPGSQRTSGRYCPHDAKKNPGAVLPCCEGPVCNDFVIQGLDLPPTATFERTVPGKYLFKWTPTAADDGKTHTFRLHMIAPNVTVAGTLWGRNDLGTKEIDETFTIHVDPCPEGYAVAPTFSVEPLHAVFTQQTFSTAYSTTVANPAGEPLTATWSGPSCDEFSPSAPVGPSTEPTQPLSMSWIHRHPPCDPTTDHAATTVVLDVAGPSGTIRCTYQGSDDGTGPACAPR